MCAALGALRVRGQHKFRIIGPALAGVARGGAAGAPTRNASLAFLRAVAKAGGVLEALDAVSVHSYTRGPPEATQPHLRTVHATLAELVPNGPKMPLLVTEWGYCTTCIHGPHTVSEQLQAAYLIRLAISNALVGVELSVWYCLTDGPPAPSPAAPPSNSYGLLRYKGQPKPARVAAAALALALGNSSEPRMVNTTRDTVYVLIKYVDYCFVLGNPLCY